MTKLSWTQPICESCWDERFDSYPGYPSRLIKPWEERCSFCGEPTKSGIYVRHDPQNIRFPAEEED